MGNKMILYSWDEGAQVISAILAIRKYSSNGLKESKTIIEQCLAKQKPIVIINNEEESNSFISEMKEYKFNVKVIG